MDKEYEMMVNIAEKAANDVAEKFKPFIPMQLRSSFAYGKIDYLHIYPLSIKGIHSDVSLKNNTWMSYGETEMKFNEVHMVGWSHGHADFSVWLIAETFELFKEKVKVSFKECGNAYLLGLKKEMNQYENAIKKIESII